MYPSIRKILSLFSDISIRTLNLVKTCRIEDKNYGIIKAVPYRSSRKKKKKKKREKELLVTPTINRSILGRTFLFFHARTRDRIYEWNRLKSHTLYTGWRGEKKKKKKWIAQHHPHNFRFYAFIRITTRKCVIQQHVVDSRQARIDGFTMAADSKYQPPGKKAGKTTVVLFLSLSLSPFFPSFSKVKYPGISKFLYQFVIR